MLAEICSDILVELLTAQLLFKKSKFYHLSLLRYMQYKMCANILGHPVYEYVFIEQLRNKLNTLFLLWISSEETLFSHYFS